MTHRMDPRPPLIAGLGLLLASSAAPPLRATLAPTGPVVQAGRGQTPAAPERLPAPQKVASPEEIREWFETADYNDNDWISYREAHRSLGFDHTRFWIYDLDRDGRLLLKEFKDFYQDSIRNSQGFEPPVAQAAPGEPPRRTPAQLRNAYDTDLDNVVSVAELTALLTDYARPEPPDKVMDRLDKDHDKKLTADELEDISEILHPVELVTETEEQRVSRPQSLEELFGQPVIPANPRSGEQLAPRIVGPIPHFRRLDLDNDGLISVEDLERLLRPLQTPVRISTVLNTLDLDGDGKLSRAEFVNAIQSPIGD